VLVKSELAKVKQDFVVLPVFQPSPYSGNSRESMGIPGNMGNSRGQFLELEINSTSLTASAVGSPAPAATAVI